MNDPSDPSVEERFLREAIEYEIKKESVGHDINGNPLPQTRSSQKRKNNAKNLLANTRKLEQYIKTKVNKMMSYRRKTSARQTTTDNSKLPWHMIKVKPDKNDIQIYPMVYPTIMGGYTINWYTPDTRITTIKPETTTNKNNIVQMNIGKICYGNRATKNKWCNKPPSEKFKIAQNGKQFKILKNGLSGLGVPQIGKMFSVYFKKNPQGRRRLLTDKRSGDFRQIYACYLLNQDEKLYVMRPGSEALGESIRNSSVPGQAIGQAIDLVKANMNFVYNKGVFWSGDRPACMMSILLGVPTVRAKPDGTCTFLADPRAFLENEIKIPTEHRVLAFIIENWKSTRGVNHPNIQNQPWFILMSIADTAHDFTKARGAFRANRQFKLKVFNLVTGEYRNDANILVMAQDLFANITRFEEAITKLIDDNATKPTTSKKNDSNWITYVEGYLKDNNSCIAYDQGSSVPLVWKERQAFLHAKLADPAA